MKHSIDIIQQVNKPPCVSKRTTKAHKGTTIPTRVKITIDDDSAGRAALDALYEGASQVALCRYALRLAAHIMETAGYDDPHNPAITTGFAINRQWQAGAARMHDVRQAGFAVHKLARQAPDELTTGVLRVVGQAIGTGHMPEHAMVASDYAIKAINLLHPGDRAAARERQWQVQAMGEEVAPRY